MPPLKKSNSQVEKTQVLSQPKTPPLITPKNIEQKAQKMDIWEELEILHKEIEEEIGIKVSDDEIEIPWISNVEQLCDELDDNFILEARTNKEPVSTFVEATKEVDTNDDVFSTIGKMQKKGFEALHSSIQEQNSIMEKRIEILAKIREEILLHDLDETQKDLNIDE